MLETELHWLAGWLEGEGSFICMKLKRKRRCVNTQHQLSIHGVSTDKDIVERAANLIGVPVLNSTVTKTGKQIYRIRFVRGKEVKNLMLRLYPLMGQRRKNQIDSAIKEYENRPLVGYPRMKRETECLTFAPF